MRQQIEGFNAASFGFGQAGTRNITLSFWHKHTKTGTYCVSIRNSAANRSYVAEYTQDITNTWEQATVTIAVDTSGTWLYDAGIGLSLSFALAGGSTFQTTANTWAAGNFLATANQVNALDNVANDFKIALVQLEPGSVATPFDHRPYGMELALCQRYYWRISTPLSQFINNGNCESTTRCAGIFKFPVTMRAAPSAISTSTITAFQLRGLGSSVAVSSASPGTPSVDGFVMEFISGVVHGAPAGGCANIQSPATAWFIDATAEL
jgi:hypothetical protein